MNCICPHCQFEFTDEPVDGTVECPICNDYFNVEGPQEPDESMDGDHESGLRDAGFGTDEDYGGGCEHI